MTTDVNEHDNVLGENHNETSNVQHSASEEKMIPQSKVNDLIRYNRADAENKARQNLEAEYRQKMSGNSSNNGANESSNLVDKEKAYQEIVERLNQDRQREREQLEQVARQKKEEEVKNYFAYVGETLDEKLAHGSKKYEDFQQVTEHFNQKNFFELSFLLGHLEQPDDVLYELMKNTSKLSRVDNFARTVPELAMAELRKIQESISNNQEAKKTAANNRVSPPLDQPQSSYRTGDNGKISVSDARKLSYLRG